jgi:hypothetical protein
VDTNVEQLIRRVHDLHGGAVKACLSRRSPKIIVGGRAGAFRHEVPVKVDFSIAVVF